MYIYSSTKSLAYTSLENPILGYGAANWDPHRERHVNTLNRVQKKDAKFANYSSDSVWETLAQRRIARICALFKAYSWWRTWKAIGDTLQGPGYMSREDHDRKIWARKQGTDIGKYSFVNRAIHLWNQLPAEELGTFACRSHILKKRVRKTNSTWHEVEWL